MHGEFLVPTEGDNAYAEGKQMWCIHSLGRLIFPLEEWHRQHQSK